MRVWLKEHAFGLFALEVQFAVGLFEVLCFITIIYIAFVRGSDQQMSAVPTIFINGFRKL